MSFVYGTGTPFGSAFNRIQLPIHFVTLLVKTLAPYNPTIKTKVITLVWAPSVSLAATREITIVLYS